jgi:transposase InsO family protein
LYAVLDDASRLIPHAQFYAHQGLDALLDCLRQAIAARGVPVRLYVDNAKVYRSEQLARITASVVWYSRNLLRGRCRRTVSGAFCCSFESYMA